MESKKFGKWCEIGAGMGNKVTFFSFLSDNASVLGSDFQISDWFPSGETPSWSTTSSLTESGPFSADNKE